MRRRVVRAVLVHATLTVACVMASLGPARASWVPDGTRISSEIAEQYPFSGAPDGRGGALVTWCRDRWEPTLSRLDANGDAGGWSPVSIPWPTYVGYDPLTVPDGAGGAFVVFATKWCPAHCGVDPTQLMVRRVAADGRIPAGWNGDMIRVGSGFGRLSPHDDFAPIALSDQRGGVLVFWSDSPGWPGTGPRALHAQRIDSTGACLWGARGIVVRVCGSNQFRPGAAPDGHGGAYVTWLDDHAPWLFAQHVEASGALAWAAEGVPLARTLLPNLYRPVARPDGFGGVLVAWSGPDPSGYVVSAARLSDTGRALWPEPARIATSRTPIDSLRMVPAERGAAVLAWRVVREVNHEAIFAQKLRASGRTAWNRGPVAVCTAAGHRDYLALAPDGRNGAFVAWSDTRPDGEVFATHLGPDGQVMEGWATDGSPVCSQLAEVWAVGLVPGADGDAYAVWTDMRTPLGEWYHLHTTLAMRLLSHGVAVPPGPSAPGRPPLVAPDRALADAAAMPAIRFTPSTGGPAHVRFALPAAGPVRLSVFDVAGRRVWERDAGVLDAGRHEVALGASFAPGVYLVRLVQGRRTAVTRIVVTR